MQIRGKSYAFKIVRVILTAGCASGRAMDIITAPSTRVQLNKVISRLSQDGLLQSTGREFSRRVIITNAGKEQYGDKLKEIYGEIFLNEHDLVCKAGNDLPQVPRMNRRMRASEIIAIFDRLGVIVFPNEKYQRSWELSDERKDYYNIRVPHFHDMKDIKNMMLKDAKLGHTRVFGLLVSAGGMYAVYNFGRDYCACNNVGEKRTASIYHSFIRRFYTVSSSNDRYGQYSLDSAIILGDTIDVAISYMINPNAKPKTNKYDSYNEEEMRQSTQNVLTRIYHCMHFITLDMNGVNALRLIMMENYHEKIFNLYPHDSIGYANQSYHTMQRTKKGNMYNLFFLDCDLHKLNDFVAQCAARSEDQYTIYCYDWQKPLVDYTLAMYGVKKQVELRSYTTTSVLSYFKEELAEEEEYWRTHPYQRADN